MIDLGDPVARAAADPAGMLAAVLSGGDQIREGIVRARAVDGIAPIDGLRAVVVCGMGGSGIAGDVLAVIADDGGSVPVVGVKGYRLPAFVGPRTIVIAVSYSGNTEETLACVEEARARGASLLVIAGGGALADRARADGLPCVAPVAGLQPRAAFPSLVAETLLLAARAGAIGDPTDALEAAARAMDAKASAHDDAVELAHLMHGKLPIVWGQSGALGVAALRWRCQLNENAKVPALAGVLPELDHNELVGFDPGLPALGDAALVVLRGPGEHERIVARIDATLALVRSRVGAVAEARATGATPVEQVMTAAMLGDLTSVYLAMLRGVDPTPVTAIESLKRTIAG